MSSSDGAHDLPRAVLLRRRLFALSVASCCAGCASLAGLSGGEGDAEVVSRESGTDGVGATDAGGIAYIQGWSISPTEGQQTQDSVSFKNAQTAGDLNVIAVGWYNGTGGPTVLAVSDSSHNRYVKALGPTILNGQEATSQSIYYAAGITSAADGANTVTVVMTGPVYNIDIRVLEYAGLDKVSPYDDGTGDTGNGSTADSGLVTTRFARELLVGAGMAAGNNSSFDRSGSAPFVARLTTMNGNIAEDLVVDTAGSYPATGTLTPPGPWVMQVAAFH